MTVMDATKAKKLISEQLSALNSLKGQYDSARTRELESWEYLTMRYVERIFGSARVTQPALHKG